MSGDPTPAQAHGPGTAVRAGETAGEPPLFGLARTMWRRKWLIVGAAAVVTGLAAVIVTSLTPRYTAEVKLMVDPRAAAPVGNNMGPAGSPDSEAIQSQVEVLFSRDLAHQAVQALHLVDDPEFNPSLLPPSRGRRLLNSLGPMLAMLREFGLPLSGPTPSVMPTAAAVENGVVDLFLQHLSVAPDGRSRVIAVAFTSASPERAAEVANEYAHLYIAFQLRSQLAAVEAVNARLDDRLVVARQELRNAEQRVEEFRRQARLAGGTGTSPATQQLVELSSQLVLARAAQIQAQSKLGEADRLVAAGGIDSALEVQRSPVMAELRTQEVEIARRIADLGKDLGGRHPELINAHAELAEVQRKIAAEATRAVGGIRDDATVAAARVKALEDALASVQVEVDKQNVAEVQARELERDAAARRQTLEALLARIKDAVDVESLQSSDAKLISRADAPLMASFPKKGLLLVVAAMAGSSLGVFLALLLEALRSGYRSMEEVEQELGVAALALVPSSRNPVGNPIWRPRSAFTESLRALVAELGLAGSLPRAQILMVTSPVSGEGKTTLAAALARLAAIDGQRVLLIDADLRRPTVHAKLGLSGAPGLGDVLVGRAVLADAIKRDRSTHLSVLPAGSQPPSPSKALGSPALPAILAQARDQFDLIVVDTPPLLPVADARLLAKHADKLLLVLRWGRTKRSTARLAMKYLDQAGAPLAGVVIGRVDMKYHRTYGYGDSAAYSARSMKYYAG